MHVATPLQFAGKLKSENYTSDDRAKHQALGEALEIAEQLPDDYTVTIGNKEEKYTIEISHKEGDRGSANVSANGNNLTLEAFTQWIKTVGQGFVKYTKKASDES